MPARCTAAPCGPPRDTTAPLACMRDAAVGKPCSAKCGRRVPTHGRCKVCGPCRASASERGARYTARVAAREPGVRRR